MLNGQPANDPDLALVPVAAGDRLMFCSDGVCGLVDDDEIEAALRLPDLDAALERLVSEALAEGGIDNITVIVADVVDDGGTDAPVVLGRGRRARRSPTGRRRLGSRPTTTDDDEADDPCGPTSVAVGRRGPLHPAGAGRRRLLRPLIGLLVLLLVAGAGLGVGVRVDPDPVLRRRGRRPGGDLPGAVRRAPGDPAVPGVRGPAAGGERDLPPYYAGAGPRQHRRRRPGSQPGRRSSS